jgi:aspartokinase-like uncharacterized kinase
VEENGLVKIGGSVLENPSTISSTISQLNKLLYKQKRFKNIIIIPGGGSLANFIRYIDKKLDIGDDLAHWEAILSMDKNADILHRQFSSTILLEHISNLNDRVKKRAGNPQLIVFKPFHFLYEDDTLAHSWNITSDSIAVYIAFKLGLKECYLIKDIDGIIDKEGNVIPEVTVEELRALKQENELADIGISRKSLKEESTPIDYYCLKLLEQHEISCILLNGASSTPRIIQYFTKNRTQSTTITPTE